MFKMTKNIVIYALLFSAISFIPTFASTPAKPGKCPDALSIRSAGFDVVKSSGDGWKLYKIRNSYDTNVDWSFAMGINAKSRTDALRIADSIFDKIEFYGPTLWDDIWHCSFVDDDSNVAVAVSPPQPL